MCIRDSPRRVDHLADDRYRVQALRRAGRHRRPVRRLRPQRRVPQARHEAARRRQRRRAAHRGPGQQHLGRGHRGLAGRPAPRREERLPQLPGLRPRADRHHRSRDVLRHHRCRAGPGPGQVQEARRRRLDADRQRHRPAGPAPPGLPGGADRGDRLPHRRARCGRRRPGPEDRALLGVRLRHGRALHLRDGPRPHDGRDPALDLRRDLEDGQHAGDGVRRGDRGDLLRGVEDGRQGARDLPRQLQGRPAPLRQEEGGGEGRGHRQGGGDHPRRRREGHRVPPRPQAPPQGPPGHHHLLHGGWRRGLHDGELLPGRRPGRGLPEDVQAGLDPRGHDGRLLDRRLGRSAVRRSAGDLRLEVHQHALRAGRHDGRPGRADGAVDRRLHLPTPGA